MEGIQVSVERAGYQGDISIIKVGGYIDTTTSSELERALEGLLKSGIYRVIIDLQNVDYISSAGWGIFISEIKGIRERDGDLKLANMIPDVYEVFELLEFHYILKAYDSIEAAIQDFNQEENPMIEEETVVQEDAEPEVPSTQKEEPLSSEPIPDSLEDMIREIALENPELGHGQIAKALNTDKYGFTRVGQLTVWKILRKMHLGSKKAREEIARNRN
ncbi:STAS domain-containing protein [candidate division KSB1 bacterium]|nr:STAS domain-containing protein [candidate division KSB1 bacterium]